MPEDKKVIVIRQESIKGYGEWSVQELLAASDALRNAAMRAQVKFEGDGAERPAPPIIRTDPDTMGSKG